MTEKLKENQIKKYSSIKKKSLMKIIHKENLIKKL